MMSCSMSRCALLMRHCGGLSLQTHRYAGSLYSDASMGIDKYVEVRKKMEYQFNNSSEQYKEKLKNFVTDDKQSMVFTEDLKNIIHIAEKDDGELVGKMINKFNSQNKAMRFGTFIFGPVIMRMYHHLDMPDVALKVFEDPEAGDMFDQLVSYQLLLDLLYKHERHDDILRVFEYIKNKQTHMKKYPKNCVIIVMATYYRQNTKESLEHAINLWQSLLQAGSDPLRRTFTFFAALAINQNAPHIALEALSNAREQKYITVRNLRILALAKLKRVDDIMPLLKSVLDMDSPSGIVTNYFTQDVLDQVQKSIDATENKIAQKEFSRILQILNEKKCITSEPLDSLLTQQIDSVRYNNNPLDNNPSGRSFEYGNRKPRMPQIRQGLTQMY